MRNLRAAFVAFVFATVSVPAIAQETAALPRGGGERESAGRTGIRNEIGLEIGIVAGGLSYARRLGSTPVSLGAGVWGAWEPPNTFDRNVWEPLGVVVFGRYWPASWLHTDVGVAAGRYVWADDCSDCSGTFVGLRSVVLAGYRFVFLGPELSIGRARDDRNGSDVGVIWGAQIRLILGWGG